MLQVSFTLNGRAVAAEYEEGMHLLAVLREHCGITSIKDGCAPQGYCGCCTILLDGRPALACLLQPEQVAGRQIVTLEGLPKRLRQVLAQSFLHEGAVQCGFCTPGIALRAASMIERGLTGDRRRVLRGLSGHLCRCTGYLRIADAIQTAGEIWQRGGQLPDTHPRRHRCGDFADPQPGEGGRDAAAVVSTGQGVGASGPRYRGRDLVLGEKPFVADLQIDGMLHAALVLSDFPRALVETIGVHKALLMPGVVRVFTAENVPGERHVGLVVNDWPVLVAQGELTRCVGDVLAIVIAESQHTARRAAAAVEVSYTVLEPVTDPVAALAPGAARVHEQGNLLEACAFRRGAVDAALAASAHVVEATFTTQRIEHAFLETEACLAVPDEHQLKVYSQSQGVHDDQRQIAAVLGIKPAAVAVELVASGGAFGGKEDLSVQAQTALAAFLLGRPVRTVLTREQSMRLHPKRHPLTMQYTAGADQDGRLTAVRATIIGDTGAYASVGSKVLERAAGHACGPYRVANVEVTASTVYTNNPPSGAMRGFGCNQAAFAIEGVLDLLAERLGLDGYDIRERNIIGPGDCFATGQLMTASCGIRQTLEAVREVYKGARFAGIACGIKNTGVGNGGEDAGRVLVRVLAGRRIEILTGFSEMGQGLFTVLRQVLHEETGIDPDRMRVRTVSDPAVHCGMTTASRATALSTEAARRAGRQLAAALADHDLEQLAGQELFGEYVCEPTDAPGTDLANPRTHLSFGYATQVVVLDDDGGIKRIVAAHDVGRAINPLSCVTQIEGAIHMGLGYALREHFACTGGKPDSLLLRDLGMLKASEMPEVEVRLIEVPDEIGGYGSKGVGEIGLVPTAPAVAAALYAFDGRRRQHLPIGKLPPPPSSDKGRR